MKLTYVDFDRSKSLGELEGEDWGEPRAEIAWSSLVQTVYKLRRVPVGELSPDNLRILAGQCLSMEHVIPLALECLNEDPWYPGDSEFPFQFPGELLTFVLYEGLNAQKREFWSERPDLRAAVRNVVRQAIEQMPRLSEQDQEIIVDRGGGIYGKRKSTLDIFMEALEGDEKQNERSIPAGE